EPFFTTKEKNRGTGLGLAVAASIVDAHEGAIRVETIPGAGTTFEIFLPVAANGLEVPNAQIPARRKAHVGELHGLERVLIVDDEIDIADSLGIALDRMGYETAPVYDSKEALELF